MVAGAVAGSRVRPYVDRLPRPQSRSVTILALHPTRPTRRHSAPTRNPPARNPCCSGAAARQRQFSATQATDRHRPHPTARSRQHASSPSARKRTRRATNPAPLRHADNMKIPAHQRPAPKPVNDTVHDAKPQVTAPLTRLALDKYRVTQCQVSAGGQGTWSLPDRASSPEVSASCDQKSRPDRSWTDPMDDALEARSQRVCHHFQ